MRHLFIAAICAVFSTTVLADEPPVIVPIKRLSMDYAVRAATASIEACREQGMNITVAIIDRGGHVQVTLRDTLAMPLSLTIAEQKAYAALNFNTATSQMVDRFTSPFSPGKVAGIVISAGGVPINAAGSILGAIGVSGAPSGEVDEACAQAGVDAISDDLEMAE
jgi:uncharacterized protein GlcG (DUF336 family)